jgi:hypothetical protein
METTFFKEEKDLQKIQEIQNSYDYFSSQLSNITIDEEKNIIIEDEKYKGTELFFESFFKYLRIPYNFANMIPTDLVIENVDRLNDEFNNEMRICKRDNVLVNIEPRINRGQEVYRENLDTSNLMEYFSGESFVIKNSYVGDYGAVIDVVHKDLGDFEIDEQGKIQIGYRIKNPFTFTGTAVSTNLLLHQLICSNGMTLSKRYCGVSMNLNKNYGDQETFIERFKNNLDQKIARGYSIEKISDMYRMMAQTDIKYRWLKPIFSAVRNYDPQLFEKVFNISWEEDGKNYITLFEDNENDDSGYKYFDTIFSLTRNCQKLSHKDRLYFEDYNSNIVKLFEKQVKLTTNV